MSVLEGCQQMTIDEFNGSRSAVDIIDVSPGDAILAYNAQFGPGRVFPRTGFGTGFTPTLSTDVRSTFYFSQGLSTGATKSYLAMLDDQGIVVHDFAGIDARILSYSTGGGGSMANFAAYSPRLYATITKADGTALGTGYVWDGTTAHTMDACFQRPMLTTEVTLSLSSTGASGNVDVGTHNVGVIFQTRNGYWTKPGPATSAIALSPASITITLSGYKITATLTPATTWPTWIKAVQFIYTTALNSFQYYVIPGTITAVTAGGATPVSVDITVADLQLRSIGSQGAGTLADDYFDLLSMDSSNNPPFAVKFCLLWGDRLVWFGNYGGIDSFFPSEQLNFEWISGDQHILQLPGGAPIGAAFVLRGILHVISSVGGVYSYVDNGLRPVNFLPPSTVDGLVSCPTQNCVTVSSTGQYALIAAVQGLYAFFGGAFPQIPMSYYQTPDWNLIDFTGTHSLGIQVKDSRSDSTILVLAPTNINNGTGGYIQYLYAWNYAEGMTMDRAKFSPWTPPIGSSGRPLLEVVLNPSNAIWEVWLSYYRQKSTRGGDSLATLYSDPSSTGIDFQYQPSYLPGKSTGQLYNHLGLRVRAISLTSGAATMSLLVKNLDGTISVTPVVSPISVATSPGQKYLALFDLQAEEASYLITNGKTANNAFSVSQFTHFYNLFAEQR